MWTKIFASVSMGAVLVFGAALVLQAESPSGPRGGGPGGSKPNFVADGSRSAVISTGERVDLGLHTDPGGDWTVFNFTAEW